MKKSPRQSEPLASWNLRDAGGSGAKEAIIAFVQRVTTAGDGYVEPAARIAVFDNDGTLWSEQPNYFQVPFIEDRIAGGEPGHDETIEEYRGAVMTWLDSAIHPTEGVPYRSLVYQPMLELLDYLRANAFKTFIVSGGGVEFVRPWAEDTYGIPPEQVVGSSPKTTYRADPPAVLRQADDISPDNPYEGSVFIDDESGKPIGINRHIGRRPIAAFGNSSGDEEMLDWTTEGDPSFGLLIQHTDGEREWNYEEVAANWDNVPHDGLQKNPSGQLHQETIDKANAKGWVLADMAKDWAVVYPES